MAELRALSEPSFAALGITPEAVLAMFSWGFGAVVGIWLIGYCLSIGIGLIRKL